MPRDYMARVATRSASVRRRVDPRELPFEFALNVFRLIEGSSLSAFEAATGLPSEMLGPTLDSLALRGLIERSSGRIRATGLGLRFLNDVQAAFLPAAKGGTRRTLGEQRTESS